MSKPVAIGGPRSWTRIALVLAAPASAIIGLLALGADSVLSAVMLAWSALLAGAALLVSGPRWRLRGETLAISRLWRRLAA